MAAEVPLLPRPRGKKPRKILRLPVPREQQKLKYQPSAGPKSQKDRRPLGKLSIVLRLWRLMLRMLYPQSGGIPPPPAPRGPPPPLWSALPHPPNPNPPPNPASRSRRRNPKVLRLPLRLPTPSPPKSSSNVNTTFNFKKADWNRFGDLCKLSLDDSVAGIEQFTAKLLDAARSSYPFIRGRKIKPVSPGLPGIQRIYTEPVLYLESQPIPVKAEAKYSGVFFNSKLNFSSHVKYLKKKCLKALNLLRVVDHTDWGADRAILLRLYRTLVRSKLDYGSVIYGSANKHVLRALDRIHHQGLRIALGAFRTTPIKSLYAEAGEPSLEHRRLKLAFNYVLKLKSLPRNPCHEIFEAPLSDFSAVINSELNLVAN
ncbi:retrovirus-related pol polyprotein from type-1 retrotransposable element r1 [Plakobranchus ocellatus]|uniref:Retrovirus-related pol polyprotein from type-1 retrotransposable element r1 n=1 Tax=Plakobranchus ocellatus TaxID=259542 RepID=A0AAV4E1Y6_9GAST|nr:retrovirus-related pol polyprotein from type-1 retrotransposable element r1 [Plakobranchus ocellatus]